MRTTQALHHRAKTVSDREADVPKERSVELLQTLVRIRIVRRLHFLQHVRMAADRALTKKDQAARQDISAFDGNSDGNLLIGTPDEVGRPKADSLAADDIHPVIDHLTGTFGHVIFGNRRGNRRFFAEINRSRCHLAHCIHHVGIGADAGEGLFDPFEPTNRHLELATHTGITAHRARRHLCHAGVRRRQRDRTPGSQALHQHAPALTGHCRTADNVLQRHENVLAARRTVHEHGIKREVAATKIGAWRVVRHQRTGDADVLLVAKQSVRVIHVESQTQEGADRTERDVALVPGNPHAKHFLALPHALADNADIGDRRGVGPRPRTGQRESRYFNAFGQTRQVVIFLRLGAVVQQQFSRPERIRHHHRNGQRRRAGGQLGHHLRMRVGRKLQTAVAFGDDHAKKTVVLDVFPGFRRHVLQLMGHLPVVDQCASRLDFVVHEELLFSRQLRHRVGEEFVPVRVTAKQLAVPPHGARLKRFALGLGHLRQDLFVGFKNGPTDQRPTQRANAEQHGNRHEREPCKQRNDRCDHGCISFIVIRPSCASRRKATRLVVAWINPETAAMAPAGRQEERA